MKDRVIEVMRALRKIKVRKKGPASKVKMTLSRRQKLKQSFAESRIVCTS